LPIVTAALVAAAAVGASSASQGTVPAGAQAADQAAQGGPLKVWLGGVLASATPGTAMRDWLDAAVADFEAAHPGTTVELTLMDPDGTNQLGAFRAAFGAGDGPDVAMMYPAGFTTTFESSLLDLREIAPDILEWFPPGSLAFGCVNSDCSDDAKVMLAPMSWDGWVLAYNKAIFEELGISAPIATWEDYLTALAAMKAAGYVPVGDGNQQGYAANAHLANMYTSFLEPAEIPAVLTGEIKLTDERIVEPLRLWADLVAQGYTNGDACTTDSSQAQVAFVAGDVGLTPTYRFSELYETMGGDNVGIMPWPAIGGRPNSPAAQVGQGWVVTRFTTNQDLAVEFLRHIVGADQATKQFAAFGMIPGNKDADLSVAPDPLAAQAAAGWLGTEYLALDAVMPLETQTSYFQETQQAYCGNKTPEDAMAAVQAVLDREVGGS
jgi:ABC-type glycerol-3-phosphate transport system substrate-binding protein